MRLRPFPLRARAWLLLVGVLGSPHFGHLGAAEEWETILQQALTSDRSQTRHEGLKQVDTSTPKGLKALWAALSNPDPWRMDWFVREGAYEALLKASGDDVEKEFDRILKSSGNELPKEAIVYSIIWKIRKEVVKTHGGNNDRKIEEAKFFLRKKRGVEYFEYVLPTIKKLDPSRKLLKRLQTAFADKLPRVRRAAITGLMAYPDHSSIPLLLGNLKKLEKQKANAYREWVLTRSALEVLTGQYYREKVADWFAWWEIVKGNFSIDKRVEEEKGKPGEDQGRTVVVKRDGVEVNVHMKVAGPPEGYPLLVVPWRGYEVDYFRPYFHGVEEICRVYYIRMPQIEDYKGLARHGESNLVNYPTELLANALADLMKESGLPKFGLLAHGPDASVLGMMMAGKYPDAVSHIVFINPRSSGSAYSQSIENVRRTGLTLGVKELVKGADGITLMDGGKLKYKASDAGEEGGMSRALQNLHFADPTEPEVGAMGYLYDMPGGVSVLNDSSWTAKAILSSKRPDLPALFFFGEKSPWTPVNDMQQVAGFFTKPTIVRLPQAAENPFVSDAWVFTKSIEAFFKGAKAPKPVDPEAESEEKEKAKEKSKGKTGTRPPGPRG